MPKGFPQLMPRRVFLAGAARYATGLSALKLPGMALAQEPHLLARPEAVAA